MLKYEFINPIELPKHYDPKKQYTTRIVAIEYTETYEVIKLEYLGEEYNPSEPQCMFPVREEIDWLIHPFVD